MKKAVLSMDRDIIITLRKISRLFARLAIFIVFYWFGILKVIGNSSANPLVADLLSKTMPFLTFEHFIVWFGVFEMVIGILFITPKMERAAIFLLAIHMVATALPLFLLQSMTWQGFLIPTLEGQYIIKNLVIVALAVGIAANLHPFKNSPYN
jgi:uncharacterized membrane protein YkgB